MATNLCQMLIFICCLPPQQQSAAIQNHINSMMTDSLGIGSQRMGGLQTSVGGPLDSVVPPTSIHLTSFPQSQLQQALGKVATTSNGQTSHLSMSQPAHANGQVSCKDMSVSHVVVHHRTYLLALVVSSSCALPSAVCSTGLGP